MATSRMTRQRRERLRRRERQLRREGFRRIAGVDEAGAGPLAGPLVAAAVILPRGARLPGVIDSKQLDAPSRQHWAGRIEAAAADWSVAVLPSARIDEIGPYAGSIEAMTRAVAALDPPPDYLLVDARRLAGIDVPQEAVVRGDATHLSIAAASILAKVHRDALMTELDALYPGYGFASHKGYGTLDHLRQLERLGPCPEHRRRYAPVARLLDGQARLFMR